ncbi:hypothetical protein LTS10_011523 [Elasticomyces elasticus]|nr:hypothetical protein LTS10_011523 [Elasticomyces elasticus]
MTLAYPVNDKFEAVINSRCSDAFLPMSSHGLPFLLQADFILTAGRHEILKNREWSKTLVEGALDLFVDQLRSSIRPYAQSSGGFDQVFYRFFEKLVDRLRDQEGPKADAVAGRAMPLRSSMREEMQAVMTGRPLFFMPQVVFMDEAAVLYATNAGVDAGMARYHAEGLLVMGGDVAAMLMSGNRARETVGSAI